MKKRFTFSISLICLAWTLVQAQIPTPRVYESEKINSGAITIDGEAKEAVWNEVNEGVANHNTKGDGALDESDLYYEFKILWSEENLYFYINVEDDLLDLFDTVSNENQTYKWDAVELYLLAKPNVEQEKIADGDSINWTDYVQLRFSPMLNTSDSVAEGFGHKWDTVQKRVEIMWAGTTRDRFMFEGGVQWMFKETLFGYSLEVMVPWDAFNGVNVNIDPASVINVGDLLGVDVSVIDYDGDGGGTASGVYNWNFGPSATAVYQDFRWIGDLKLVNVNPDPVTSIKSNHAQSAKVYPNPVNNTLHVANANGATSLEIIDLTGKVLLRQEVVGGVTSIDMESYTSGIYFVILKNNNQVYDKIKIIK